MTKNTNPFVPHVHYGLNNNLGKFDWIFPSFTLESVEMGNNKKVWRVWTRIKATGEESHSSQLFDREEAESFLNIITERLKHLVCWIEKVDNEED